MPFHPRQGQVLFGTVDTKYVLNPRFAAAEHQLVVIAQPLRTVYDERMNRLFGLRQTGEFVAAGQRFAQPFAQDLPACTSEYLLKGGIHIKKLEIGTGRSAGDRLRR